MFDYPQSPRVISGHVLVTLEKEYRKWLPESSGEHPFSDRVWAYLEANPGLTAHTMCSDIATMKDGLLPKVIEDIFREIQWNTISPDFKLAGPIACAVVANLFAMQASVPPDNAAAWKNAAIAEYYLQQTLVKPTSTETMNPLSALAKKAANARHHENRQQKKQFKEWLEINRTKYPATGWKNRAAARAATELGLNERTIRNWLTKL